MTSLWDDSDDESSKGLDEGVTNESEHADAVASPVPPAHRRRRTGSALAMTAVVLVAAGGGFVYGHFILRPTSHSSFATGPFSNGEPSQPFGQFGNFGNFGNFSFPSGGSFGPSATTPSGQGGPSTSAVQRIATAVDPGLVDINITSSYSGVEAEGTGMVLSSNGLVVTNNHVIDGETTLSVRDVGNGKTYTATVVGYDNAHDVAVLQLENASGLTTVKTTSSASLAIGEQVVGIGNAGGVGGTPSAAGGAVVALHQSITATDESSPTGSEELTNLIEVNSDIQAGDSGGSLVNDQGQVIGMDTAASGGVTGSGVGGAQGFAIGINTVLGIVHNIVHGTVTATNHLGPTALLGIEVASPGSSSTGGAVTGVTVAGLVAGAPAASSGLVVGDVITSIDGTTVKSVSTIVGLLRTMRPSETVHVRYTTVGGTSATIALRLVAGPPQ